MRIPWPTRFARPEVILLTPERDFPTSSWRTCGTARTTTAVAAASATSAIVAFRPQATATATTIPAASATKLDCENEIRRPSHVATTTA